MKTLWALLILATTGGNFATAGLEANVTYEGKYVGSGFWGEIFAKKVYLMTREIPGREGSFLGLVRDNEQIAIYIIDQASENTNSYVMIPLEGLEDGDIGIRDDGPSLVLTEQEEGRFSVSSANSGNDLGVTGAMTFYRKTKRYIWTDEIPGDYYSTFGIIPVNKGAAISAADGEGRAEAEFFQGLEGRYVIIEQFPGMYSILAQRYLKWGREIQDGPPVMGVFIKGHGSTRFYLMNPQYAGDVLGLTLRKRR